MIAFVHFHTVNWSEGSRLISSNCPKPGYASCNVSTRKKGCWSWWRFWLEGSTVVGITWKNVSKCVMHSFIFLLYGIAADDGDHKKPSQTIHGTIFPGKEKTYISIQKPPGSRMSPTWTMAGPLPKWHLSIRIQPEWPWILQRSCFRYLRGNLWFFTTFGTENPSS